MRETAPAYITVDYDEYLRIEEASFDVRHELVGGVLHAMVGVTKRHAAIVGNLYLHLRQHASNECHVFMVDVKLRTDVATVYYPDLMVVCDPSDTDPLVAHRPCLVIEVLSPGTSATDRREKLIAYQKVPSLLAYLIVHQDAQRVERHWRETVDSPWHAEVAIEGSVRVPCPDTVIPLTDVYAQLPA